MRVLMLDGGRQALPFLRALKRAGHHVAVACGSKLCEGYFSRYPDRRLLWGDYFHDPDGFTEKMLRYLRRRRPDVTLCVGDVSAGIVARNKQEVTKYTRVTVPDLEVFDRAADKGKTMSFCMENDIPCPRTGSIRCWRRDTASCSSRSSSRWKAARSFRPRRFATPMGA